MKHGENALEDKRVKAMLEARTQRGVFKVSKVVEKLRLSKVGILDYIKKMFKAMLRKKN